MDCSSALHNFNFDHDLARQWGGQQKVIQIGETMLCSDGEYKQNIRNILFYMLEKN